MSGSTKRPKLGRNETCHCGSGVKYKKCCLPREEGRAQEPGASITTWTEAHDRSRALAAIAGLQLIRENQFHVIRLDAAAEAAARAARDGRASVSALDLCQILRGDRYLQSLKSQEDPPETVFTD